MAPVVEVTDTGHASSLLLQLNEQRLRGQFCDITIIAEDTKFKAHKNVLAASSFYFKEVLSEESVCRQPGQILELPDIQADIFSDILNFIYNSRLSVSSPAAAKEIGALGRRLGITRLETLDDPEAKMDDPSVVSSRPCSSPIDLTCPSRSAEPSSPVSFQDLAKVSSPGHDVHPDTETETAKILYNLSSVAVAPPPSDMAFMLKGSVGWDRSSPPGDDASAAANAEGAQDPASPCSPPSGASYPASSTFCCSSCNRSFTTSSALSLHVKLHRTRRSLSCRQCGKTFIHIKRLQTHEVLCREGEKPKEGAPSGETPPDPGLLSKPTVAPSSSKKGLMFRHRGPPRGDYLSDQDHFVKVVDGHIIYFCTVCERSYMTLSSLKRHSNVHSWRRKYPCRYCDKVFALAEYRTKHEVWHTGERRYQCIFCWETFVTYYNLKTHQKAFHGINPGLISSEKTPNGGYKPKLNALKLYRLLPMRSQKRPYKTYSQGLVPDNLLLPAQPLPVTLGDSDSLDGNLVSSLGTGDVASVFAPNGNNSLELPEVDCFHGQEPPSTAERSVSPSAEKKAQPEKQPGVLATETPTVIAYGRPTSSVIVHSTLVKSQPPSVITYNSRSSEAPSETGPLPAPGSSQPLPSTVVAKPIKKQVLRDYIQSQKAEEQALETNGSEHGHRARGPRAGRTMTYMAKPAYVGAASESRTAPLCQITVRIGEEAIVKRRISETDLMLDKGSGRVGGSRRFDFSRGENVEKLDPLPATPHGKHGDRTYGNESGEEESDHGDTEDQLWRPYYSYKPKRKACGGAGAAAPKTKKSRWRRRLRSLRWLKRTEKAEEEEEEEEASTCASVVTSEPASADVSGGPGGASESEGASLPHRAGGGRGSEWKHVCGVCGKLFSALKKLRKHERVHGRLEDHSLVALSAAPPHRVGRKPLVKFTCAHCAKVCKTAAALSRHMKRHEGKPAEEAPVPAPTTVITYSKKAPEPPLAATPSPTIKEETTQEMQVSSSSGEPLLCLPDEVPEEDPAPMELAVYDDDRTLTSVPAEENPPPLGGNQSPFPEEPLPPGHPPPLEATASLVEMLPSLPHSLQDPVISHTGLLQKPVLTPQQAEEERYPVQEYPLPLLVPSSCRTRKDLEDKSSFLAYPSTIQFNAVGRAGSSEGDAKVSFYPDPYPLMYGHQLLAAYPYNFPLPVALNMVVPDDKGQPLPFLPSVFTYAMNPCRSEAHEGGAGSHGGLAVAGSAVRESRGGDPAAAAERLKKGGLL
uniref:Zinc finger and BTB domain-containing protein 4 n=1 Tax=Pogona vitticeps TaxID=103695 RepID=A0ABM5EJE9_9SAUR